MKRHFPKLFRDPEPFLGQIQSSNKFYSYPRISTQNVENEMCLEKLQREVPGRHLDNMPKQLQLTLFSAKLHNSKIPFRYPHVTTACTHNLIPLVTTQSSSQTRVWMVNPMFCLLAHVFITTVPHNACIAADATPNNSSILCPILQKEHLIQGKVVQLESDRGKTRLDMPSTALTMQNTICLHRKGCLTFV